MRRITVLAALVACIAAAACWHPPPLLVPGPTTVHPPGYSLVDAPVATPGVRSVVRRMPGDNVVALRVVFAAGSADDPAGKEGLTRLTATTMAEGGTEALTYTQLVEQLYPLAASIDVAVDRDETVFSVEVPKGSLAELTPLFEQVLLSPRLDADGFARVRAQASSQLVDDLRGADDEELGKEVLEALIYDGHPYGHPVLGTERGLAAATVDDVKAQRARVLCRDRMTVGVAGDLPQGFAEKLTADLAALPACEAERAPLPSPKKLSGIHVLIVDKPSADATAISIGYAYDVTRSSADFPALKFFADYLGLHRQSSGRLFQRLRVDRGLNYGDYAYAEHFAQDGDSVIARPNVARRQQFFSIWVRPVKPANALFALHAALREYGDLLAHPISSAEIARYRTFLTRVGALEQLTATRRLGYAIDDATYGLSRPYVDTMHAEWQGLDEMKLAEATRRHLTTHDLAIAIVARDGAAVAAALAAGAPVAAPKYEAPKTAAVTAEDLEIERYPVPVPAENIRVVSASDMFKQ